MNTEQKQQAKNLFLQTELSKTQIADLLNISRRSLHYWIKEGNWERLKQSAAHLPSLLAENCYHIMGHLTEHYLSERRLTNPVNHKEIDALYKLTLTINKLKNRTTLNENMEMFAYFLDGLKRRDTGLAQQLAPHVDDYLSNRASVYINNLTPDTFTPMGRLPFDPPAPDSTETNLDGADILAWDADGLDPAGASQHTEVPEMQSAAA